jgi:hypothetical protein
MHQNKNKVNDSLIKTYWTVAPGVIMSMLSDTQAALSLVVDTSGIYCHASRPSAPEITTGFDRSCHASS